MFHNKSLMRRISYWPINEILSDSEDCLEVTDQTTLLAPSELLFYHGFWGVFDQRGSPASATKCAPPVEPNGASEERFFLLPGFGAEIRVCLPAKNSNVVGNLDLFFTGCFVGC